MVGEIRPRRLAGLSSPAMAAGSDSDSTLPPGGHGDHRGMGVVPFDQDAPMPGATGRDEPEEPDFDAFLAAWRQGEQSGAGAAATETDLAAALADEALHGEGDPVGNDGRPPVVAVVPTAGGRALERCLAALAAQDYPALTVLVLDTSPGAAPLSARVVDVAPKALVRRVEPLEGAPPLGFAEAANDAIETVSGATFLLLCADDVILEPGAVRVLVDEAVVSNAGVVGPKLVSDANADLLVDVGWMVDRYGEAWSIAEPGERDQEQHDAVRDVFFVTMRAMLVRADLFEALAGFDPACGPAADRDLAWRARLAGARVIVAPEARGGVVPKARGGVVPKARRPDGSALVRATTRGRLRALYKASSPWSLAWALPVALALTVAEAFVQLLLRRGGRSAALLAGVADSMGDLPELRRARRDTQASRAVPDAELHVYMVRGSARIRRLVTRRLHVDERLAGVSLRTRAFFGDGARSWKRREGLLFLVVVAVSLVATRGFVTGGTPAFGGLLTWPSASTLLHAFTSGHRSVFLGSSSAPPPLLAVCGVVVGVFLGHAELARTALVVSAAPLGMLVVYRMLRRSSVRAWPALAAAIAYGANPVSRNALARGELGVTVTFVLAPLLWVAVCGAPPDATLDAAPTSRTRQQRVRRVLRLALVTAFAIAWWPPAVVLPVLFAAVALGAGLLTGLERRVDDLVDAAAATVIAVGLLLPWSVAFFSGDGARIGLQARSAVTLKALVSVDAGVNGAGWLGIGLLVAAGLPLLIATGDRLRRAVAAWLVVVVSLAVPLIAQHIDGGVPLPAIDGMLVVAALGLSIAVGLGVAAFLAELRSFIFGARQLIAVACLAALAFPFVGWFGDVADGRVRSPHSQWNDQLSWMNVEGTRGGDFRVLWLGPSDVLPGATVHAHGVEFALSDNGVGDVRSSLPSTSGPVRLVGESIALAAAQQTVRLGRLLAPMAVRYVAVIDRSAPTASPLRSDVRVARALDAQLDLELYDTVGGLRLYRNDAWAPRVAVVAPGIAVPSGADARRDPIGAALATDLSGARPPAARAGPGTLVLADHAGARATLDGKVLAGGAAFGWAHAWKLATRGVVAVHMADPWLPRVLLVLAFLAWCAVAGFAFGPRFDGQRTGRQRSRAEAARRV